MNYTIEQLDTALAVFSGRQGNITLLEMTQAEAIVKDFLLGRATASDSPVTKHPLPAVLSPFGINHPATCAWRITLSPHEWTWTQVEQEAMARAVVELQGIRDRQLTPITILAGIVRICDSDDHRPLKYAVEDARQLLKKLNIDPDTE